MSNESSSVIDYTNVLADLKARRVQLDTAIAAIEQLAGVPLSGTASATASGTASLTVGEEQVKDDSFFGLSIPDAARKFLGMRKRPASTPDIADALKRGGLTTLKPETFANTVGSVLNRIGKNEGSIVKVGRGKWGLAEWYPGRRKGKKQNDEGEESSENGATEKA